MKKILKPYIASFILVGFILILSNLLSTIHPIVMKKALEVDFSSANIGKILVGFMACYSIIQILCAITKNLRNIQINKVMAKLLKDIRQQLFEKVLNFDMATYQSYNSSELYTRLTVDVDNIFTLFFGTLQIVLNNVLYIIFMIIMMFVANLSIAMIGMATIFVIAITAFSFIKKLKKIENGILQTRDKENQEFSERYDKNKLTYLFGLQEKNLYKSDTLFETELKYRKNYIFLHHFMYPATLVLEAIGIYAILYYALTINIDISVGSIYLVLFYIKQCRAPLDEMFTRIRGNANVYQFFY